jgi:hypothetical protein
MIADLFTKLIQGKRFLLLRDMILNVDSSAAHRSVLVNNNSENVLLDESETDAQGEPCEKSQTDLCVKNYW